VVSLSLSLSLSHYLAWLGGNVKQVQVPVGVPVLEAARGPGPLGDLRVVGRGQELGQVFSIAGASKEAGGSYGPLGFLWFLRSSLFLWFLGKWKTGEPGLWRMMRPSAILATIDEYFSRDWNKVPWDTAGKGGGGLWRARASARDLAVPCLLFF
jgi:hypothetical protein